MNKRKATGSLGGVQLFPGPRDMQAHLLSSRPHSPSLPVRMPFRAATPMRTEVALIVAGSFPGAGRDGQREERVKLSSSYFEKLTQTA